jgi:hypothetical protein
MNTKHPLYKEKIKIQRELEELYDIKRNQNLIPYDKPVKYGYKKVFDLRDDIKNRDDAWVFFKCIELVGKTVWNRDKSFKRKIKKGKYEFVNPGFGYISEKTYEAQHPAVKKYFSEITYGHREYHPYWKRYQCHAPSFFFVVKTKPNYITHYREHDSVIESEIAEKEDVLWGGKFYAVNTWRRSSKSAPKDFRQGFNRSDRRHGKRTVKKNVDAGGDFDSFEYRYSHRHGAAWIYW